MLSNNKKIERTEGIKNAKHRLLYFTTADKHETTTILSLDLNFVETNKAENYSRVFQRIFF